jgi:predicted RNA methylase
VTEPFSLEVQYPRPSKAEQEALDAYDTPEPLARAICDALRPELGSFNQPERILVPSAGTGAFVRAASRTWAPASIAACDIAPRGPGIEQLDFLSLKRRSVTDPWARATEPTKYIDSGTPYDLIIDNPPWSLATEFVEQGLRMVRSVGFVAYLLRTTFWGGQDRVDAIFRQHMPRYWMPLRERPDYTGEGGDSSDSSVFVWQRGFCGRTEVLPHLHWRSGRG